MVQVLAEQHNIDRTVGDNETTLQAEATRIRADLARTCGHIDITDIGSTERSVIADRGRGNRKIGRFPSQCRAQS
eukprot:6598670-Pyramimonas_sp.AAC.1